jgi:hypothetical protein
MLLIALKRQDFVHFLLLTNWNQNRNQNFSKVGTGTSVNHYGSTKLVDKNLSFLVQ